MDTLHGMPLSMLMFDEERSLYVGAAGFVLSRLWQAQ